VFKEESITIVTLKEAISLGELFLKPNYSFTKI
jgi:hypothetical protein